MILEDITDTESSICTYPVSNHSPEAYFIFILILVMKYCLVGGNGGVCREDYKSLRRREPRGFHI